MPVTKKAPAPRVLWKGAISFGLVHIPVALYSATVDHGIDFDWLDKRTMDPVGYKRVNKKTGKEIAAAYPKTTQTIEIESFVPANGIPFVYLERPYYVAPINRGAKVYALLRETLQRTGRVGVARVVIQTKQHLAALVPVGPGLVLNLLRWGADIRPWSDLPLPSEDVKKAGLRERELEMAKELVEDMSADWDPEAFRDEFKDEILRLVDKKVKAGQTETVIRPDPEEGEAQDTGRGAKVIDLTELLKRSLRKGGAGGGGRARNADAEEEDEEEEEEPEAPRTRRPAAKKRKTAARSSGGSSGSTARSASARQRRAA